MLSILSSIDFSTVFTAQNFLSAQAILIYILALLVVILWVLNFVKQKGELQEASLKIETRLHDVETRIAEIGEMTHGLHDGFAEQGNEFKFFKENVMGKLTSSGRILETLPKLYEQLTRIQAEPADPRLKIELRQSVADLEEATESIQSRDETIRSMEEEMDKFRILLEEKSLGTGDGPEVQAMKAKLQDEKDALEQERAGFEEHTQKIKAEIQRASDQLRQVQSESRIERERIAEERQALEEEKTELAQMPLAPTFPPESVPEPTEPVETTPEPEPSEIEAESDLPLPSETVDEPIPAEEPAATETSGWGAILAGGSEQDSPEEPEGDVQAEQVPVEEPEPQPEQAVEPESAPAQESVLASRAPKGIEITEGDGFLNVIVHYDDVKRPEAQDLIDRVFERTTEKSDRILLDFSRSNYINSSGMSALTKIAVERDCQIVLVNSDILKVIDLMGFLPLLNINETYEEALEAFMET